MKGQTCTKVQMKVKSTIKSIENPVSKVRADNSPSPGKIGTP